jgi:cation transport ATPase
MKIPPHIPHFFLYAHSRNFIIHKYWHTHKHKKKKQKKKQTKKHTNKQTNTHSKKQQKNKNKQTNTHKKCVCSFVCFCFLFLICLFDWVFLTCSTFWFFSFIFFYLATVYDTMDLYHIYLRIRLVLKAYLVSYVW